MAEGIETTESTGYWFTEDPESVANRLQSLHGTWSVWGSNPVAQSWVRHSIMYYSSVIDPSSWDSSLVFEGEQGELVRMSIPQARSLIRQLVTLITKQKLAMKAIAESTSRDVIADMRLGNALADHVVDDQRLDSKGENLVEQAFIYGMSFLKASWRTDRGDVYVIDPDDDAVLTNGDLEIQNYSVFDVFYDYATEQFHDLDWCEVRTLKNKWSLIAQFPDKKEAIKNLEPASNYRGFYSASYTTYAQDDTVYVYEVYHRPTPALPQGRMIVYAADDLVLYDGPNPYKKIPIVCMKPESIHGLGMGFGYPFFANLLPAQEMLDHSFSAIATNQSAFAVQNITVPRGADISVEDIGGMNWISFTPTNASGGGKPEALQLTQSSPESFKFIDVLLQHMTQISNINSALRGEPPPGVTSGAAIATLTTNAIEFISSAARSYKEAMEDVVTCGIETYRTFAKTTRIINIVGKNYQSYTKQFKGDDLNTFKHVRMTQINPLLQTLSGRMDIAEKLMQNGLVTNMREYIAILDGEPLDRIKDVEQSENDLIAAENEDMLEGKDVLVLATDDHATHIREHHAILNNPAMRREDNPVTALVLEHIMEHYRVLKDTDPGLLALVRTGQMPEGGLPQAGPPPAGAVGPPPTEPNQPAIEGAQAAQPAEDMLGRPQGEPQNPLAETF